MGHTKKNILKEKQSLRGLAHDPCIGVNTEWEKSVTSIAVTSNAVTSNQENGGIKKPFF